jgi:hypothetical protein
LFPAILYDQDPNVLSAGDRLINSKDDAFVFNHNGQGGVHGCICLDVHTAEEAFMSPISPF